MVFLARLGFDPVKDPSSLGVWWGSYGGFVCCVYLVWVLCCGGVVWALCCVGLVGVLCGSCVVCVLWGCCVGLVLCGSCVVGVSCASCGGVVCVLWGFCVGLVLWGFCVDLVGFLWGFVSHFAVLAILYDGLGAPALLSSDPPCNELYFNYSPTLQTSATSGKSVP